MASLLSLLSVLSYSCDLCFSLSPPLWLYVHLVIGSHCPMLYPPPAPLILLTHRPLYFSPPNLRPPSWTGRARYKYVPLGPWLSVRSFDTFV